MIYSQKSWNNFCALFAHHLAELLIFFVSVNKLGSKIPVSFLSTGVLERPALIYEP